MTASPTPAPSERPARAEAAGKPGDPLDAIRAAFPSSMAASALAQIRVARVDEGEVHLTGPAGAIGVFRSRIDDVSRALSGSLGRRVRAVLVAEIAETPVDATESRAAITMEQAREHPLVLAAKKAFNAEIQRVDPAPRQPPHQSAHQSARPSAQEHTS